MSSLGPWPTQTGPFGKVSARPWALGPNRMSSQGMFCVTHGPMVDTNGRTTDRSPFVSVSGACRLDCVWAPWREQDPDGPMADVNGDPMGP